MKKIVIVVSLFFITRAFAAEAPLPVALPDTLTAPLILGFIQALAPHVIAAHQRDPENPEFPENVKTLLIYGKNAYKSFVQQEIAARTGNTISPTVTPDMENILFLSMVKSTLERSNAEHRLPHSFVTAAQATIRTTYNDRPDPLRDELFRDHARLFFGNKSEEQAPVHQTRGHKRKR